MAAYTFRAATKALGNGVSSLAVNKPAGTVQGDLIVLTFTTFASSPTLPAGFTLVRDTASGGSTRLVTAYLIAGASEPSSYTITTLGGTDTNAVMASYGGSWTGGTVVSNGAAVLDSTTTVSAPTVTTTALNTLLVGVFSVAVGGQTFTPPGSMTEREDSTGTGTVTFDLMLADELFTPSGATGVRDATRSASTNNWEIAHLVGFHVVNTAPDAPNITAPTSGATFDRTIAQRFDWDFSDVDVGDSQSKYDLDYRLVGAGSWTTVTTTTPNTYHDFASSFFAAGDYEWRVRTYDSIGVVGAYSATSFFTAATAPANPTITAPINGSTISSGSGSITWSAPDQDSYQVRKVADLAGSPDTATVYYDSGEVVSTTTRTADLTYPTNSRFEHLQVRIKSSGLWSTWASVRVNVSYTSPATPTATATAGAASIAVTATHPTPTGSEPTVTAMDVYRRKVGDTDDGIRVAAAVAPGGTFTDWAVASGVAYEYRVEDLGDNGTSAFSAWDA